MLFENHLVGATVILSLSNIFSIDSVKEIGRNYVFLSQAVSSKVPKNIIYNWLFARL